MTSNRPLSPWFQGTTNPVRRGVYRVQDHSMRCRCCYLELEWNGEDWHARLEGRGFNLLFFKSNVRRWRGLGEAPK